MAGLTKRQAEVLDRIRNDGALMRHEDGFAFISGETAHARVIKNLLNGGKLVENKDALFHDIPSQTLRAAE